MKKVRKFSWFLLLVILFAAFAGLSVAQENPNAVDSHLTRRDSNVEAVLSPPSDVARAVTEISTAGADRTPELAGTFVGLPERTPQSAPNSVDGCSQLIVNPTLDIVEFGDGFGSAEPWVILDQIVYYNDTIYTSKFYSLVLIDSDIDDSSPEIDTFAQGFYMPENLTSVRIDYNSQMLNTNSGDLTYANIWTLDSEGYLDEWLFDWEIADSHETWTWWYLEFTNPDYLQMMEGKVLALRFENYTNNILPGEKSYFDDITLEACTKNAPPPSGRIYLPTIVKKSDAVADPICLPPTENPQDQYNANRGMVQTNAVCNSTLSSLDRADYYAYVPSKSGKHTLKLTDLLPGTEWSAMMFFDTASPSYVPGPTGGDCRIGIPGAGEQGPKEVTCPLTKNVPLIVKVSAGSTPVAGPYTMRITGP